MSIYLMTLDKPFPYNMHVQKRYVPKVVEILLTDPTSSFAITSDAPPSYPLLWMSEASWKKLIDINFGTIDNKD